MRDWRKLYASIIASERLGGMTDAAFRLFVLLVVAQDDEGKYPWTPTKIRSLCVGTNWDSYGSNTALSELSESGVAVLRDGFVYLTNGAALNGTPTNSRKWPLIYKIDSVQQSNSISDTVLSEYSQSTDTVLSARGDKIREDKNRGEENPRVVDEIFRQKMRERFGSIITGVDARIDDALEYDMNRSPSKRAKNVQQFVRNWLLKDVDRITAMKENTNGRVQQVNERKLRGDATGWAWRTKSG
jgi:hypothetical protein